MERFGFFDWGFAGMYSQWFETLNMPRLWHMPVVVKTFNGVSQIGKLKNTQHPRCLKATNEKRLSPKEK
jgi:hypothetical protein